MLRHNIYVFSDDPSLNAYRELMHFCCSRANHAILVVGNHHHGQSEEMSFALDALSAYELSCETRSSWPGTRLIRHTAMIHVYMCSPGLADKMCQLSPGLFGWIAPARPEDPCFMMASGRNLLTSISHEKEAYMSLSSPEVVALQEQCPSLFPLLVLEGPDWPPFGGKESPPGKGSPSKGSPPDTGSQVLTSASRSREFS